MTAPTAQDAFARLVREVVAPELRRQGLNGSGSVYVVPDSLPMGCPGSAGRLMAGAQSREAIHRSPSRLGRNR